MRGQARVTHVGEGGLGAPHAGGGAVRWRRAAAARVCVAGAGRGVVVVVVILSRGHGHGHGAWKVGVRRKTSEKHTRGKSTKAAAQQQRALESSDSTNTEAHRTGALTKEL